MGHAVQPVEREQATAAVRSAETGRRWWTGAAVVGAAAAVTGGFLHPLLPNPVGVMLLVGGAVAGLIGVCGGLVATNRVRYRVTIGRAQTLFPLTVLAVTALGVAWGEGGVAWAPNFGKWPANLTFALLPVLLLAQFAIVMNQLSLFDGDAAGVRFCYQGRKLRRTRLGWDDIAAVVVAPGRRPGSLEIGVRPRPGATTPPMPVRGGEVLTDLPYRIRVPVKSVDIDGLRWMLNQSGRTDIALVQRTPAGEWLLGHANRW